MERSDRADPMPSALPSSRRHVDPSAEQRGPNPRLSLAVALLGFFVITLDALVVNVALPAIRQDLGGGITGQQWVVDGYTLLFAALLLVAAMVASLTLWPGRQR